MLRFYLASLLALAALFVSINAGDSLDLDVPSNVANRSMAIKGQLFCGKKPLEAARIRLYRTYQKNAADDQSQILDTKQTYITGIFQLEGTTAKFPPHETEIDPYVTIHHNCDMDEKQTANLGYKRWSIRLPVDYVTIGTRARKVVGITIVRVWHDFEKNTLTYDFGKVNLQLEYPGETHDKKFEFKPDH